MDIDQLPFMGRDEGARIDDLRILNNSVQQHSRHTDEFHPFSFDINTSGGRHFAWVQLQQAPWNYLWWRLLAWGSGLCIFSF